MKIPEFPGLWDYEHDLTTILRLLIYWKHKVLLVVPPSKKTTNT